MRMGRAHSEGGVSLLAVIGATHEEIAAVAAALTHVTTQEFGRRRYHVGILHGTEVVAVFSRWGKVAAAATATQVVTTFAPTQVIFTGVAGAVDPTLSIGDIAVGTELIQHDMDATPIFPRYEIPLLDKSAIATDPSVCARLTAAAQEFLRHDLRKAVPAGELAAFEIAAPKVRNGLIASGDKFFASAEELTALRGQLPAALCVEMEGAAVAQVCDEYGVSFGIVRTISDTADHNSVRDFSRFSREIAGHYSVGVLSRFVTSSARARAPLPPEPLS
jgi:adenosylhomocysteine nucleosidase